MTESLQGWIGLLLLAAAAASGVVLARRRFSAKRVLLDALALAVGGVIGMVPGAYLTLGRMVVRTTGTGRAAFSWPDSLLLPTLLGGLTVGALVGLVLAEGLQGHRSPRAALLTSFGGLAIGCALCGAVIVLTQRTSLELAALALMPTTVIGTTLAGYALRRARRR